LTTQIRIIYDQGQIAMILALQQRLRRSRTGRNCAQGAIAKFLSAQKNSWGDDLVAIGDLGIV
jgi:hypothetical protein